MVVMVEGWMNIHWKRSNVQELVDRWNILADVEVQWLEAAELRMMV